jgi:hypothetical protein
MAYPDNKIFYVRFGSNEFIIRDITKKEFMDLKELAINDMDFEDLVCQLATVSPKDIDFYNTGMAGLSATLFPLIIQQSDLEGKLFEKKLLIYQGVMNNSPDEQQKAIIKSVFPEFSYDIMNTWTYEKFVLYLARAEFILTKIHGKENAALTIVDDEKEDNKETYKKSKYNEADEINKISWGLIEKGIDPILSLWGLQKRTSDELPRPFIGSYHWKDEGIMDAIARQIREGAVALWPSG